MDEGLVEAVAGRDRIGGIALGQVGRVVMFGVGVGDILEVAVGLLVGVVERIRVLVGEAPAEPRALDLGHMPHKSEQREDRRWHRRLFELVGVQTSAFLQQRRAMEAQPRLERCALVGDVRGIGTFGSGSSPGHDTHSGRGCDSVYVAATRTSAGLVLYRREPRLQVLLGHMGGPFWARRDDGAWSIPKGEYGADEDAFAAAKREFAEELGSTPPTSGYVELGDVRQSNGKVVTAWAVEGDLDADTIVSNTFEVEWPPRSGRRQSFPEIDRAAWFDIDAARPKLVKGQSELLDRLAATLSSGER